MPILNAEEVLKNLETKSFRLLNSWKSDRGIDYFCDDGTTLLTKAVRISRVEIVSYLITAGADTNLKEKGGASPLFLAIHLNRLNIVQCLIRNGANVKLRNSFDTPLTIPVREDNIEMTELLINNGADPCGRDVKGISPLFRAIKNNKVAIANLFLKEEIGIDFVDVQKNTPLIAAIRSESSVEMITCILKHITDVSFSKNEKTPLAWAAEKGNLEVVKILLRNRANVNMLSLDGNTPLATAVRNKRRDVVRYLTSKGAKVCKFGEGGKTPLLWAVLNGDLDMVTWLLDNGADYIIDSVFLEAIATKNLNVVRLLKERGAVSDQEETTPLIKALQVKDVKIAKYLIENGADVVSELGGEEIDKILRYFGHENIEMVKLLVENGARLDRCGDVNTETLLTEAIKREDLVLVKYLLAQGANINQTNGDGLTPLVVAEANNDFEIFQYLVDCGATIEESEKTNHPKLYKYYQKAKEIGKIKNQESGSNQESAN